MNKYLLLLSAMLLLAGGSWAQVSAYSFGSSSGTYTVLTAETILWSGTFDENVSASVPIPDFIMDGIVYTNMYVSSNGFITLGTTAPSTFYWTAISGGAAYDKAVSPFCADLENADSGSPKVSYNTNDGGLIVVQWQDVKAYGTAFAGHRLSFQLKLNPSDGSIRFKYGGTITGTSATADIQVGLRGTTNSEYTNRTTTSNWSATTAGTANTADCSFNSACLPSDGLTYIFTVPPVLPPLSVSAAPMSISQIDLSVTPNFAGSNVLIVWNNTGIFTLPTGAPPATGSPMAGGTVLSYGTSFPVFHTSLNPATKYYYAAFSYNGYSWSDALFADANTFCNTLSSFPETESFDGTIFEPVCWTNVKNGGTSHPGTWDRETAGTNPVCAPHSGAGMARFNSYDYDAGTAGSLATPQLALLSDQYEVHFLMYRDDGWGGSSDSLNVYYNTNPNTTGATLLGTVHRYYTASPSVPTANQWYEYAFDMPGGSSGNAFIVFQGVSMFGNDMFLDDVKVKAKFPCPAASTSELESCGADLNGGCNMTNPAFEPIAVGQTKCGTAWSTPAGNDTDWYNFTLTQMTNVTLTGRAEFPLTMGFYSAQCPAGSFIAVNSGAAGETIAVNATLNAGTYYIYIAPSGSVNNECGNENKYWIALMQACPAGSSAEVEPCGADLNGGCNMAVPDFESIVQGETKCGTAWSTQVGRDTDWYMFTLSQTTDITLTGYADFLLQLSLIGPPCSLPVTLANNTGPEGTFISCSARLGPGTWYAVVSPMPGANVICGFLSDYFATLTGSTCFEPTDVTASQVTTTTATLSWTAPTPEPGDGYAYEVRTGGSPGSGPAGLTTSGTTGTGVVSTSVSGLVSGTTYFIYVRSECGGGVFSQWSMASQFTTPVIPVNLDVQNITITGGQSFCYNAFQTITVAGGGSAFVVLSGGSSTMIAGLNISYLPGTLVHPGGYMLGYIAPSGPYCPPPAMVKAVTIEGDEFAVVPERKFFRIYPNPTTGNFTIEQKGTSESGTVRIELYGMRGEQVFASEMTGEKKHEVSPAGLLPGLYFVKLVSGDFTETIKLIVAR